MTGHSHIRVAAGSDIGKRRHNNQDNCFASNGIYVVCDGMGGGVGGERASALAIERFKALANESVRTRKAIESTLNAAQHDVYNLGRNLGGVAGTTATGIILPSCPSRDSSEQDGIEQTPLWYVINVGDSRTYHFDCDRQGAPIASSISHITKDHSQRQQAIDLGLMPPEMANATIPRNIITQCIGAPQGIKPDFYAVVPQGRFVICSDGLYAELDDASIGAICHANPEPQQAVDALITAALNAGGDDNITVIVVDVNSNSIADGPNPWHASRLDDEEELETLGDVTLDSLHTV
ncbi:serine/threonine-protein phosphatase [Bifidobacterium sp. ESL0682]|uniref:PP2C family protein-serine/threonine phosphatase n=1 Tax=Bifidobacterium sp. ESL0682 TaxID=2983212 RepID=UPI0023F71518|nr:serine/threonine-protein phosphatase [Bifidobacterium sp. ESL0682]WEV42274.1 serine/threonine-protein phosphatase [Bifidobacterium sp. ESL0682]